jgi:hypothetical protein
MEVRIHQYTNESGQLATRLSRTILVHKFTVDTWGDDDHVLLAKAPFSKWVRSDAGQWVAEHAIGKPEVANMQDWQSLEHRYIIRAELYEQDITFYQLKWG